MSPLELLAPETVEIIPFSVRLAERRLAERAAAARADRRAHLRRNADDLEWLSTVRLTGGTGYDVRLVDLSEGGALLEVDAPLRPGVTLTLEMTGPGLDAAVPLEVLRCYIASLRGENAIYRGACAFAHLIEIPGRSPRPALASSAAPVAPPAANFVGTAAALTYLLDRCASSQQATRPGAPAISLARTEVIHILDALRMRTSTRSSDLLSRYTSDLLSAILPALHDDAPRDVALAALDARIRVLPRRWRSQLQATTQQLMSLVDHCASANAHMSTAIAHRATANTHADPATTNITGAAPADIASTAAAPQTKRPDSLPDSLIVQATAEAKSAFQKIVARQADGKILKGYTQDFHPSRPQFSLWPSINATPKERTVVAVARLKAVFFVRDFDGDPSYQESKVFDGRGQGRRIEVTFSDGEVIVGTTLNYRPDTQGFMVSPADAGANNSRIFVVTTALRRVRFL
jgi:hypothetical protein